MLPTPLAKSLLAALAGRVCSEVPRCSARQLTNLSTLSRSCHQVECLGSLPGLRLIARAYSITVASSAKNKTWLREVKGWSKIVQQLSKARLSALVVSTTAVGYVAGSGETIDWAGLGWTALGTFGAAACANTLNQIYEVANDSKMKRTMMRPLPLGRVSTLQALAFAGLMGVGGTAILAEKANTLTACLGGANIFLYAGIYTPLKVVSAANTWIGAVVGGIPPLMGWTAASGSLEPGALVLASALYFWQLPHFLSLAWLHREDYMRGGFAMLSRFDPLGKRSAACALRNSLYMLPLGAVAVWVGTASMAFAYEATIAAGTLASTAAVFFQKPSLRSARMLFRFSILFLPFFMAGLVVHRMPNTHRITFQSLKEKLSQGFSLSQEAADRELGSGWSLQEISAVPLPFLPVPLQMQSSTKLSSESRRERDALHVTRTCPPSP